MTCDSSVLETTGPSFAAKTIAYSSRFLAYGTLEIPGPRCDEYVVAGGFHTIDFDNLYYNPITTSTTQKAGCPPYANPRLSLPADLTSVDPAWASCEPLFYGAFDPPIALKKARGGLAPLTTQSSLAQAIPEGILATSAVAQAASVPAAPTRTAFANGGISPGEPLSQQVSKGASLSDPESQSSSPAGNEGLSIPADPSVNVDDPHEPTKTRATAEDSPRPALTSQLSGNANKEDPTVMLPNDTEPIFVDPSNGALLEDPSKHEVGFSKWPGQNPNRDEDTPTPTNPEHAVSTKETPTLTGTLRNDPGTTVDQASTSGNSILAPASFPSVDTPMPLIIAGQQVQRYSNGEFLIASQTLVPGDQTTVSGIPVSAGGDVLMVGGVTHGVSRPLESSGRTALMTSDNSLGPDGQPSNPGRQTTLVGDILSVDSTSIDLSNVKIALPTATTTSLLISGQSAVSTNTVNLDGPTDPFPPDLTGTAFPLSAYTTPVPMATLTSVAAHESGGSVATFTAPRPQTVEEPTVVLLGSGVANGSPMPSSSTAEGTSKALNGTGSQQSTPAMAPSGKADTTSFATSSGPKGTLMGIWTEIFALMTITVLIDISL